MVLLSAVQDSNGRIASSIAPELVAVFVGGTNGIGLTTLKQVAKYSNKPRIYFTGRCQESADQIITDCNLLNKQGEYIFIKSDTSSIKTVDSICQDIQQKEPQINLLFTSTGTLLFGSKTEEDLHYALALCYYSRIRFISNLLPLLQRAKGLRRVVSVHTGTKEGPINVNDFPGYDFTNWKIGRGHASSMLTLMMAELAKRAPTVSFIHDYPGFVKTAIARDTSGMFKVILKTIGVVMAFRYIPIQECGERHLFLATSDAYPPAAADAGAGAGVPLNQTTQVARGYDGKTGSGMYIVDEHCESASAEVESLLQKLRREGVVEKLTRHTSEQFNRITGSALVL